MHAWRLCKRDTRTGIVSFLLKPGPTSANPSERWRPRPYTTVIAMAPEVIPARIENAGEIVASGRVERARLRLG